MNRLCRLIASVGFATLLISACAPGAGPEAPTAPAPKPAAPAKTGWEAKWDTLVAGAKKEGKVSVYAIWRAEERVALSRAFNERFGIEAEFMPFTRGAEMLARVQGEKRAGLRIADVFGAGGPTLVATMRPEGLLGSIEPLLVLPEVLDPGVWGGKFPFYDGQKTTVGMVSVVQRSVFYNNEAIREGELTSFKDLLKPQYKGKIVMNDPTVTGGGNAMFTHLARRVWNVEEASDFLRRLVKDQEAVIVRDARQQVEWVARGKYSLGLGENTDSVMEFMLLGAPLSRALFKETMYSSPQAGAMSVPWNFAHPNAAAVFVNWLLTKEGQTVFSRSWKVPSARQDVPTEGIHPALTLRPGEKIVLASEEFALMQGEMLEVAKKIIQEAGK
ncbi:MAG: ABC transporter substrate-binding protein [Chloroflexi bacterium]|nr:ABC transporter substrate-binding protein [Chloroflexota bacterium]